MTWKTGGSLFSMFFLIVEVSRIPGLQKFFGKRSGIFLKKKIVRGGCPINGAFYYIKFSVV